MQQHSAATTELRSAVRRTVAGTPVFDIHTHLYSPRFGGLLLWGLDELLVYHYLVAEGFRHLDMPYDRFFALRTAEQAELIWDTLFVQHSPLSEAARGVLTTLRRLGLDVRQRDLTALRKWFAAWNTDSYIDHCMQLAGVRRLCMTNSPFDPQERPLWDGYGADGRFATALRIDPLLLEWETAGGQLRDWGYAVEPDLSGPTVTEVRRFLGDWSARMQPLYLMVSLPPEFAFPDAGVCTRLIQDAVLPHCRDHGQPFALMLGVRRAANPALGLAGDSVGRSDLNALLNLCAAYPDNKFLTTVLARENQHELCVLARKFRNLHLFGCWWFTNIPLLVEEMTRLRLQLLGTSFTAQHSDARVLDQLIYKWDHSRAIIADVMAEAYERLATTGWQPTQAEIERDVHELLGGSFEKFCGI